MKKKYLIFIIVGVLAFISVVAAETDINYPISELGECKDKTDCKIYCDNPDNKETCLAFAQKNNLMSEQEVNVAKKFINGEIKGPGGCNSKDSCEEYCNDISRIDECVSFAEENNLMPAKELEEAKKVKEAIARGVKPPPCNTKKQCDNYCDNPEHLEECIVFAEAAGFMQGKELEDAQKMLGAVKRGIKPPPCRGKEACDEYCSNPDNMEMCMGFAIEAGFMNEQEKQDAQKMLGALKKGIKPPPCRGREECDTYCNQEGHFDECTNFAVAAGFMNEKDAEMARKTGGKGPGGCKGKEECETFCNNPENQETCFNFAKDNGMMPEEEIKKMEEGKQQLRQTISQMPQEIADCLTEKIGSEIVEKIKNGFMPPRDLEGKMRGCFEKIGPQEGEFREPKNGERKNFRKRPDFEIENPGGQIMPQQAGPGGCKGPEECQKFCENNPDACKNFRPNQDERRNPQDFEKFQKPPCEGENCRPNVGTDCFSPEECATKIRERIENQRPPEEFKPPIEGGDFRPPEGQPMEGFQPPSDNFSPPPTNNPPPPEPSPAPSPVSKIINTDSLVGSIIDALYKKIFR